MPMRDSENVIIFNGEIYNYKDLKNDLEKKVKNLELHLIPK